MIKPQNIGSQSYAHTLFNISNTKQQIFSLLYTLSIMYEHKTFSSHKRKV